MPSPAPGAFASAACGPASRSTPAACSASRPPGPGPTRSPPAGGDSLNFPPSPDRRSCPDEDQNGGDPHHPGPVEPGAAAASRDGPPPTAGDIASEPPSRSAPEPRCRIEVKGESRRAADIQVWYRDDRGWQFACGELADSLDGQFAQPPLVEEGAALVGRRQTGSNGGVVTPPKGKMPRLVSVGRRSPTG